jgi:hypothetical protein
MNNETLSLLQSTYAIPHTTPGPLFSTLGSSGPTALNQSEFAIGQQQRANNLYAETTFVCPSYWLASAYSSQLSYKGKKRGLGGAKQSWKYQFSAPPSEHGADLDAYQVFNRENLGEGAMSTAFRITVQLIWGRFIIYNDPTFPSSIIASIATASKVDDITAASTDNWPVWEGGGDGGKGYKMLNLNMTGGVPIDMLWTAALLPYV